MNYNKACDILKLNSDFDLDTLKRQYRKYALIYHPDKNMYEKYKFYDIKDAYEYLLEKKTIEINCNNNRNDYTSDNDIDDNIFETRNLILYEFLKYINLSIDINKVIYIINNFNKNKINYIKSILSSIKYEYLIELYEILTKYKIYLNINKDFLVLIEDTIKSRFKNYIILHPSLEDIYKANVYKLVHNNEIYYVPLWHSEIYYRDQQDNLLIVKCIPELPDNINIDDKNNLHINHKIKLTDVLNISYIEHEFLYKIPIEKLHIKQHQIINLYNKGIPNINIKDVYSEKHKKHIYIYVELLV